MKIYDTISGDELALGEYEVIYAVRSEDSRTLSSSPYYIAIGPDGGLVMLFKERGRFSQSMFSVEQVYSLVDWSKASINEKHLQKLRLHILIEAL